MTAANDEPQRYIFGWMVACAGLSNIGNPPLVHGWGSLLGAEGAALAGLVTSVLVGLAAAAVRPWSWYVLLVSPALGLVWIGLYGMLAAPTWSAVAISMALAAVYTVVSFAYFYKRRALFGAQGRWRLLERWWPRVTGPEMASPGTARGFAGLSLRHRLLFGIAVALLISMGRV